MEKNISLKQFNTFKVGGEADYFCKVFSVNELKEAIGFAKEKDLPIFVLGGGSNILVSDSGFRGLVIKIELKEILCDGNKIIAGAGVNWDEVVKLSIENELYGIENLSFIPGTIGGAIVGNIGAYGSEIKDTLEWVEVYDIEKDKLFVLNKEKCKFNYRDSIFKKNEFVITKICLKLSKKNAPDLSYKDLKEYFGSKTPDIKEVRNAIGSIRSRKFPNLDKYGAAGSFFKNPIIKGNKIHLAKVLDELGMKGLREGDTALYEKQSLVVLNCGDANANEIKMFTDKVAEKVFKKTKIKITPEVVFVGEFKN